MYSQGWGRSTLGFSKMEGSRALLGRVKLIWAVVALGQLMIGTWSQYDRLVTQSAHHDELTVAPQA